ncbi:glycoside hydrolase superfamily [Haematococcus lacustris]
MPVWWLCLSLCLASFSLARLPHHTLAVSPGFDNGLGRTPPMGYNTWNAFGDKIDEGLMRATADLMLELGLVQAGYTYLNLDDGWQALEREPGSQRLQPHPQRFPSGMPALVTYAADRGLKLGLYTDVGALSCAGYPGSLGYEQQDAAAMADWGIQYLKVDNCYADPGTVQQRYEAMGAALNASGHPLLLSLCSWGMGLPWQGWGRQVGGHTWRVDVDISPQWHEILHCADSTIGLAKFAGPGGWNDPDMLEVGNGALSEGQQRAHFALWAVLKAPLLIGADLRRLPPASLAILKAREVIAVNQDKLGAAGDLIWAEGTLQVWGAPLAGGAWAVVLLNRQSVYDPNPPSITVPWALLGWEQGAPAAVRDLFAERDILACQPVASHSVDRQHGRSLTGRAELPHRIADATRSTSHTARSPPYNNLAECAVGAFTAVVPSADVVMLRITPVQAGRQRRH